VIVLTDIPGKKQRSLNMTKSHRRIVCRSKEVSIGNPFMSTINDQKWCIVLLIPRDNTLLLCSAHDNFR
jgi:hypothetical protein